MTTVKATEGKSISGLGNDSVQQTGELGSESNPAQAGMSENGETASTDIKATPTHPLEEIESAEMPKEKRTRFSDSDVTVDGADSTPSKESVHSSMQQILEEAQEIHAKSKEAFRKSEAFEAFAIVRVEALLKDACALKERLQHQKQALIARLKAVTGILEESGEQDYVANTCT